jgi:hypothetical protein
METITVMTPYLPDDERAQRLNALRLGEIELTKDEKLALQAARGMLQAGKKPAVRGVHDRLEGRVGWVRQASCFSGRVVLQWSHVGK